MNRRPLRVDLLALEGASPSGVGVTIDLLDGANRLCPRDPPFTVRTVAPSGGAVPLRGGLTIEATPFRLADPADAVIVLGLGSAGPGEIAERLRQPDCRAASRWLATVAATGVDVLGACTGTFLMGEAGLLDGRRCTTTWWLATTLTRRYPTCQVDPRDMVVRDGRTWTAGASLAQIDLVLTYLEYVLGPGPTRTLAQHLAHERRSSQGAHARPWSVAAADQPPDEVIVVIEDQVTARIRQPITLADLAAAAHLSPRTLARRTRAAIGMSPMQLVQRIRLDEAIRLIEHTDLGLDQIAQSVGMADTASLYRLVKRTTGRTPSAFRRH